MDKKFSESPFFNVFLFSLFWALSIIVNKLAFVDGANPVSYTIQYSFIGFIFTSLLVLPKRHREIRGLPRKILTGLLIANLIHAGIGAVLSSIGIALTTAVNSGFLLKFPIVTTPIIAYFLIKERLTRSKVMAIVLMLVGSFLISTSGKLIIPNIGDLIIITASIAWSFANVMIRKILRSTEVHGDVVAFLRPVAGIPFIVLTVFISSFFPNSILAIFNVDIFDVTHIKYLIINGLLVALLTIYLNRTLKVAAASYLAMMSMMTPVFVSIFALSLLGEGFAPVQIVGAVIIILSGVATHYIRVDKL